jgi:hypothetical protein
MDLSIGGVSNVVLDTSVLYNGSPSIRVDPVGRTGNTGREVNGPWLSIKPGDHIVFKCWMKTSASTLGDTSQYSGARIGIDFYTDKYIVGTSTPDGKTRTPAGYPAGEELNYVHWGTSTWTQIVMDFVVASKYPAEGSGYSFGQMVTPTHILPWMQVYSSTYGTSDSGKAWFANAQLYINP